MNISNLFYILLLALNHRRIVGIAHVEDFESITDLVKRSECERWALDFAKMLMKKRRNFNTIHDVISAVQ